MLTGMIIGLLASVFLRPTCWGPLIGVFVASYLGNVSSPKEGATIGAIVLVPIGIYAAWQYSTQTIAENLTELIGNIVGLVLGILLGSGIGAVYGLIIGKLFQLTKNNKIIF